MCHAYLSRSAPAQPRFGDRASTSASLTAAMPAGAVRPSVTTSPALLRLHRSRGLVGTTIAWSAKSGGASKISSMTLAGDDCEDFESKAMASTRNVPARKKRTLNVLPSCLLSKSHSGSSGAPSTSLMVKRTASALAPSSGSDGLATMLSAPPLKVLVSPSCKVTAGGWLSGSRNRHPDDASRGKSPQNLMRRDSSKRRAMCQFIRGGRSRPPSSSRARRAFPHRASIARFI